MRPILRSKVIGFKNFKSACSVISGIEIFQMLKKNQAGKLTPLQEVEYIHSIMLSELFAPDPIHSGSGKYISCMDIFRKQLYVFI